MRQNFRNQRGIGVALLCVMAVVSSVACKGGTTTPDGGVAPPDSCNSQQEAVSLTACHVTVNAAPIASYISVAGDKDWYSLQLPSTVTSRSLLQITAGYGGALGTPVDFSANVLKSDGSTSLATGVDHPTGAPHYVNLVLTLDASYAGQTLLLLVGDSSNSQFDNRTPYHIQATLADNPDVNEPNDTPATATPITATATGYLATPNDVDQFTFVVPNGRKIAYVHVTSAALTPPAPPQLILSYQLFNPAGTKISEAFGSPLLANNLATARLSSPTGGKYRLVVQGYKSSTTQIIPGDLRFQYTVNVLTLDDVDANEPNDVMTDADTTPASHFSVGVGASATRTGRISYVGDADWYRIDLASAGAITTLHYKLTPSGNAGRFAALPGPVDRLTRIFTKFTLGAQVCQDPTDQTDCPKDLGNTVELDTANSYCASTPSLCLRSQRYEDLKFSSLRNFEGVLSIPAGGGTYYVAVQDDGLNWADDSDYTITFTRAADTDDNTRAGLPSQTQTGTMPDDPTYMENPGPAATLTGVLSYGHGHLLNHTPINGDGVRAPHDYDGQVSDVDRYQLTLPTNALDAGWLDRAWSLQWTVEDNNHLNGSTPESLFVTAEFCDGTAAPCTPVTQSQSGSAFMFAYTNANVASWQNRDAGVANLPAYRRSDDGSEQTSTVLSTACFCFEPRLIKGGYVNLIVSGVDRDSWDPVNYTVKTSVAPYPQSYDGGVGACPTPQPDGMGGFKPGCLFTHQ